MFTLIGASFCWCCCATLFGMFTPTPTILREVVDVNCGIEYEGEMQHSIEFVVSC